MRLAGLISLFLILGSTLGLEGQASQRFAYIDSQAIQEAPMILEAQQQLEREVAGLRVELEQMDTDFQAALEQYQQQELTMSDEAKTRRQQEILEMQNNFTSRQQTIQLEMQRQSEIVMGPILEQVNQVIQDMREEGGYAMIFDVSASGFNYVVAADPGLDLTQEVIRRLGEISSNGGSSPQLPF